jgi:glutathione synthase
MKLLFVADPLEEFKIHKDSTFAMMREAAARGHTLYACETSHLLWARGGQVCARIRPVQMTCGSDPWFGPVGFSDQTTNLTAFDAVIMRKDPPFNSEFFYATHLLEQAEREGARVFNRPSALREHPEKLAIMAFPQFIAPTLVTKDPVELREFHSQQQDIILKPLDGMGGKGIFRVGPDGLNLGSIIETLNDDGRHTVMAQRYLPEITQGDKRILLIAGKPVPYALARIPQGSEIRGNLAAGGKGVAQPLSPRDREIAEYLGPILFQRGLMLVGLDVIGDCLTEINVTSPTGFQEIQEQTGFDVAACFVDAIEPRNHS